MAEQIDVFQDMSLRGPITRRAELRAALIAAAVHPWRVDLKRSAEVANNAVTSQDVVLFRREAGENYPAIGLTLWGNGEGYYVPNIVPLDTVQLTCAEYNAALADFIVHVVEPVAGNFDFIITTTAPRQGLVDWLSPEAASQLRRFSTAANKSTGSSHPADKRRWFQFLISAHRSEGKVDATKLARWLNEAEGWDDESAHELAIEFEQALALLEFYDEN